MKEITKYNVCLILHVPDCYAQILLTILGILQAMYNIQPELYI